MHLSDETLRAYLDHELDDAGAVDGHLEACGECQERLLALRARATRVNAHLSVLDPDPGPAEASSPARLALAQFNARYPATAPVGAALRGRPMEAAPSGRKEISTMLQRIFAPRLRPGWIGLGVVLVFAIALTFQPVRTWAGSLLALFRVEKVVVLPVDNTRLSALSDDSELSRQISQLFSDEVKVTKDPGEPRDVADAAAASQEVGFPVRLPASRTDPPQLSVQDAGEFEFVADLARAQAVLRDAGFGDVQLPESLDGALIQVHIPAAVTAGYGECPKLRDESEAGRSMRNCVILAEMPSPTVDAPSDLDVKQLAEIGLQFTGMTAQEAHDYSEAVDWASTLVVPIPRNGSSYEQVTVDGVQGNLIQRPRGDAPQYALVWVKDGIIYAISGLGNDPSVALAMANSLQ